MPYRVLVGINLSGPAGELRYEPGDVVERLRPDCLPWMLEQGVVEKIDVKPPTTVNITSSDGAVARDAVGG